VKNIKITDIRNIHIGNAQNLDLGTGCTVIIAEKGAPTGIDVRGGGPASRDTHILDPMAAAECIHAVLLSGGSAFGLGAANGVQTYLLEKDIGFDTGIKKVPLVCQSCIFDLPVGSKDAYPDAEMAYQACIEAQKNQPKSGNYGAGTGASVGKILGPDYMMKSGLGMAAVQVGDLQVGAIVAVNALGDIFDAETGKKLAGLQNEAKTGFTKTEEVMYQDIERRKNYFVENTTIGTIITNGKFNKTELTKIAALTHNGYARAINPVHTMADGDSIYAMSVGDVVADISATGTLAAHVMTLAIKDAVVSAKPLFGLKSACDYMNNPCKL